MSLYFELIQLFIFSVAMQAGVSKKILERNEMVAALLFNLLLLKCFAEWSPNIALYYSESVAFVRVIYCHCSCA